ncbi:MAG: RNA recognition motif domain-containing protein [Kiritimatiellia bacterium]
MNCCIHQMTALFQGESQCAAVGIAIVAFVLGVICTCLACRLFGRCRKQRCGNASSRKPLPKREERPFEKRKPHPAPADGSVEIYVGNLSYDMTEEQLRKEFEAYGKVNSARLIANRFNGKSKGYGFVQMPDRAEAERAVAALNDREIMGRKMRCNEAKNLI